MRHSADHAAPVKGRFSFFLLYIKYNLMYSRKSDRREDFVLQSSGIGSQESVHDALSQK